MGHPTLPTVVRPCRSGNHEDHEVILVDELTARCTPPCEAAKFGHTCHHVTEARDEIVRLREREVRRRARTGGSWLPDMDWDGIERAVVERVAAEAMQVDDRYADARFTGGR